MSLFSHGDEICVAAGEFPSPARGQLLHSFGPPLLNNGPLLYNILPAQCCNAAPLANNVPSQNNNGALLYNNTPPLPCAAALLSRAGTLQASITPAQYNGGALQDNSGALLDNNGAKLSSAHTKERNDALRHERATVFRIHFTDAVQSKTESPILCPMPKQ